MHGGVAVDQEASPGALHEETGIEPGERDGSGSAGDRHGPGDIA